MATETGDFMNSDILCSFTASLDGDTEAFGQIIRRYQNMVSAVTFSMTGNLQQSEDLAQETFVTAWQKRGELRDPKKLPAWLCGIARNLTKSWMRKTKQERSARQIAEVDQLPDRNTQSETDELSRLQQAELVWATIRDIPQQYREPLVMYYRENQAVSEIAIALELSEDNVRQRIARGRSWLKTEVERKIETALEQLRPTSGFVLLVLASIPAAAAATTSTALAGVTSASSVGSIVGKSGGGLACFSVSIAIGWVWMFLSAVILPIIGIVFGCRTLLRQIRNLPSLRLRRLTLRSMILMQEFVIFVAGSIFAVAELPFSLAFKIGFAMILLYLLFICWIFHVALSSRCFRRYLEEEAAEDYVPAKPIERTWLSRKTLFGVFVISLLLSLSGVSGIVYYTYSLSHGIPTTFIDKFLPGLVIVFLLMIPIRLIVFYIRGMQFASEEGMQKYPSEIPNILDVVFGRAEMPEKFKSFRGRAGADMIGMGCLMFGSSSPFVLFGMAQPNPWWGYVLIGCITLLFLVFAKCFAGKPKWRHLGWIVTSMAMCLLFMLTIWVILRDPLMQVPELYITGIAFYVIFGLISFLSLTGYCCLHENELNQLNEKYGINIRFK